MSALEQLAPRAEQVWQIGLERLYHEKTNLFYDYVTDYDQQRRFDHLPTPAEIKAQYPNPNGWATGMEDSTINGGVMLACLCDRHAATGDPRLRQAAASVYQGLKLCGSISREPGFVVRSVSPFDGVSYYIETSRDQLTHFVAGLWRYFNSPLSDDQQKTAIKDMMIKLAERMRRRIIPENDHRFGREDGSPGLPDRMWGSIAPHEYSRLPMIYGVVWQMTGGAQWEALYLEYARAALGRCAELRLDAVPQRPCYGLFQHQCAMDVLAALAPDATMRDAWHRQMRRIADAMPAYAEKFRNYRPIDVRKIELDFRKRHGMPSMIERFKSTGAKQWHVAEWPEEMACETALRELGESILTTLLSCGSRLTAEQERFFERGLTEVDYRLLFSYAMLYPQAAYWKWAAR